MHRKGFPGRQRIGRKIYHVQRVKLLAIKRGICLSYSNINDVVIDAILSLLPNHVPFLHYLEKKNTENRDFIAIRIGALASFFHKEKLRYALKQRILICIIKPIAEF